jgi:hypothetical protein
VDWRARAILAVLSVTTWWIILRDDSIVLSVEASNVEEALDAIPDFERLA